MKQTILLTGGSGGIGSELGKQLLEEGHDVYFIVRNLEKTQTIFSNFPNAHIELRDLEDYEDIVIYCRLRAQEGIIFDKVLLLAGDLRKDSNEMFAGDTVEEKEKNSIIYHELVNVRTAETVVFGLKDAFGEKLKNTVLLAVSSWAAHFEVGHPYRKDEEGYVRAKARLSQLLSDWQIEGFFKEVICEEPALIVSPMTEREFPELIANPEVQKLQPTEYVIHLRKVIAA
jgi:NAD(P)-dependent dehydrogenase (short-subunit alcohol dehydrogenase family)